MSSTQLSGHHLYDHGAGAYGRDGAPADNFMSSPPHAHRHPSPQRPNIASSERPFPPIDRFSPRPSAGYRTSPPNANPFASPYDPKLSPPKAAFLEAASVTDYNYDSHSLSGLTHGESEKTYVKEEFYRPVDDLKRTKSDEDSSAWLKKQAQAGSKFKTATWVVAIVSLIIIAGLLAKIISTKPPVVTSPKALKWANGASTVPNFGANATNTDPSQSPSSTHDPKTVSSPPSTSKQRRSLNLLD